MRKKIAFKPHETRGKEIIKILEGMGGVNKYNLDGSKGIIAIDNLSTKSISNDWDYRGLIMNGWKVYTLEEYEKLTKTAQDFAVDILTKVKECYFDDLDVEIVAESYMAGYNDAIEKVKGWLKDFCYEVNVTNIRYGADVTETKVYTEFDTIQDMFDNLQEEIMEK